MSSYAVTGASRGIGRAFLSNLSSNPSNTIIALVRNKAGTEKRVAEELSGRTNVQGQKPDCPRRKLRQIHLFNLFTPLILRGTAKKVIAISSGHADFELVSKFNLATAPVYAISKVALNMAVPNSAPMTEEQRAVAAVIFTKFQEYAPTFTGARQPADSVKDMLDFIHNATVEKNAG
ncbi:hypothetical protein BDW66DRAFT_146806 [Aspergillus desertorum]